MDSRRIVIRLLPIGIAIAVVLFQRFSSEKFTNELGRTTHLALSVQEEKQLGVQAYEQVLRQEPRVESGPEVELVRTVAGRLARATGDFGKNFDWAVSVVRSSEVNAFCLPGGKIVVYTGILPVSKTDAGLATVMGHEMAHATSRHGSERMRKEQDAQTIMAGARFSLGDMSYDQQRLAMGLIGAAAKYGVLMPYSRDHESEADALGLRYMARAGYDPREAVTFWQRMESSTGRGAPPEFMSTHPSHGTRIAQLKALLPDATKEYQRSAAGGGAVNLEK